MNFHIITLFPKVLEPYFNASIIGRAKKKGIIKIKLHNFRDFLRDKKRERVDARPYGGGPGMVIRIEPLIKSLNKILVRSSKTKTKVIIFSPAGREFNDKMASDFAKKYNNLILVAGHYEGIDERIKSFIKDRKIKYEEISTGLYVLTGGEAPAMILVDAVSRKLRGVLGKEESLEEKRIGVGVPVYTRPETFVNRGRKYRVPKVLLSGNHASILKWRLAHKKK